MSVSINPAIIEDFDPDLAEWFFSLSEVERDSFLAEVTEGLQDFAETLDPPGPWDEWLKTLFPNVFYAPFADRHIEFWEHVDAILAGVKPKAFFAVWCRGGAKTTNAEGATVYLAAKERRKFCLYIRATQDKANESIQNIAAMLETKQVESYYPELATRKIGKYGNSKGWRIDTLRCGNGFSVIGLGLDAAVRGIKIEEFRPDLIILDDIDDKQDSAETLRKKIDTLTHSILPAGSVDVAVIGIQNLIHPNSIFNQLAENRADFLYDRIVSGPYPAVEGLTYEQKPEGGYRITAGVATWEGQNLTICEAQINEWGLTAFLQEAQHEVDAPPGGMWDHVEFKHIHFDDVPEIKKGCVWVDPAVTDKDQSDSHGIQADGLGVDGKLYRFYSWEQRTSPEDSLKRAILKAVELGFETVGVETDQGGDTWRSVYSQAWQDLVRSEDHPQITEETPMPRFVAEKAGAGHGSKVHRNSLMLLDYERGNVLHVIGTCNVLEKGLRRFPLTKPFDVADAAFWGWYYLIGRWSSNMRGFVKV